MSTYSIGTPPTDATKLANLQAILNQLPDNTSKLIKPKDVRDAIYTTWEFVALKPTTIPSSATEYIGIDSILLKEKIFIGKKQVSGQYVMNASLLSSDVDIFFYNTKSEPPVNNNTKIAILAGTGSNFQAGAVSSPFLESSVVSSIDGQYLNFNIGNTSYVTGATIYGGDINIKSDYGVISLNGVILPTYLKNQDATNEGYALVYRYNSGSPIARWEQMATASGLTNSMIYFTDSTPMPVTIGSIQVGETFSNVPIDTIIRRILYPYIGPSIITSFSSDLIESGNTSSVNSLLLNYTTNRTSPTASITYLGASVGAVSGSFISPPVGVSSSSVVPVLYDSPSYPSGDYSYNLGSTYSYAGYTWSISISDSVGPTSTSTSILNVVIPWYYGSSTVSATQSAQLNPILNATSTYTSGKLTPLLAEPVLGSSSIYNKTVTLVATLDNPSYLYFGYPADFPDLYEILDGNGFDVTSAFNKWTITGVNSPNTWWSGKNYKFYIYVGAGATPSTTTLGSYPTYSDTFQFKFA